VENIDRFLSSAMFVCMCTAILLAPWLFGAWEMCWFWPCALLIFLGTFFFSVSILRNRVPGHAGAASSRSPGAARTRLIVALSYVPFLAYALVRFAQAEVYIDAERSFLRCLTPFLVGIVIMYGFTDRHLKLLHRFILADLLLLGLYGIVNHVVTNSRVVLWRPGIEQYMVENRATGSYFCPDHYSGAMEMALCLALGLIAARGTGWKWRTYAAALSLIALAGVVLSKSRGGGLTVLAIGAALLVWGFSQYRRYSRWCWRVSLCAAFGIAVLLFATTRNAYMDRFNSYFEWDETGGKPLGETAREVVGTLRRSTRGQLISTGVRMWKTAPVFGIGPGMHQNLWPHFAATTDGDRENYVWPSFTHRRHSFEVHCDWVQLLEEYGAVGLVLFLVPCFAVLRLLHRTCFAASGRRIRRTSSGSANTRHAVILGGLLAFAALAVHSLGDFNLQIPANLWLFAALMSLAIANATGSRGDDRSPAAQEQA